MQLTQWNKHWDTCLRRSIAIIIPHTMGDFSTSQRELSHMSVSVGACKAPEEEEISGANHSAGPMEPITVPVQWHSAGQSYSHALLENRRVKQTR